MWLRTIATNISVTYSITKNREIEPTFFWNFWKPSVTRDDPSPRTDKTVKDFYLLYFIMTIMHIYNMVSLFSSLSYSTQQSAKGISIMDTFLYILQ